MLDRDGLGFVGLGGNGAAFFQRGDGVQCLGDDADDHLVLDAPAEDAAQ